jgi:hypothetical protein
MNGESCLDAAVNGLAAAPDGSGAGSLTTANGESWRFADWLGKLSNIPRFVLILAISMELWRASVASPWRKEA